MIHETSWIAVLVFLFFAGAVLGISFYLGRRAKSAAGYFAACLDYARPEVRDYYMALIQETLDRYDIDGLELDFMREPYVFSADKEREGAPILTGWLREVRQRVGDGDQHGRVLAGWVLGLVVLGFDIAAPCVQLDQGKFPGARDAVSLYV